MRFLRPGEVAERMGVTVRTLETWAGDPTDDFPKPVRKPGGKYRYVESDIEGYQKRLIEKRDREQKSLREAVRFKKQAS